MEAFARKRQIPVEWAKKGVVYRQVLSLILSERRPSYYLVADRNALNALTDKYLRALTEILRSSNQTVLMFPIETATVLGTLGSIAEIVNATFGGTSSSTRESAPPRPTVRALTRNP